MNRIDCDATKCVHNTEGKCNAAIIHVRGGSTVDYAKIYCGTYSYVRPSPHSPDDFLFEVGEDMSPPKEPGQTVLIACSALKCEYFRDYECRADKIYVRDPSFTQKHSAECATFQPE